VKPAATIKLRKCYRCERVFGPLAGRYVRVRIIEENRLVRIWLCDECFAWFEKRFTYMSKSMWDRREG